MERIDIKKILEALLYMTDHPLTVNEIVEVFEGESVPKEQIEELIAEIKDDLNKADSGLTVMEVAGGVQIATRPLVAKWIRRLYKERLTVRLSSSALETLSIVAYKQPIARSEVEQIRGVEATGVMDTLLERRLIKVVGRKETIGRPLLYGTTTEFLRQFGLKHLSELPDLSTISPSEGETPNEETVSSLESASQDPRGEELVAVGGSDPAEEDSKEKVDAS